MTWPILSLVIFLPLAGVALILALRGPDEIVAQQARQIALWTSIVDFAVSLLLWTGFDYTNPGFQFVERFHWMPGYGIDYHIGVDGISLFFVLLSTFLTPICILASWEAVVKRVREYMLAFLALETLMVGTFCSLDFVIFYFFFEGVLIPMYLIIGIWGGPRRVYAAFKFFLYTLLGSVLMLLAILGIYAELHTTDIPTAMASHLPYRMQLWMWLAFFASFAVKMPMWPVHTWLPDAHVEAPTAGSVILAGVLLKIGGYGFLRFSVPIFPDASLYFAPLIYTLSVVAIVYTSLVALAQQDMKKLIAYSSVAHMGFVTIGIFTINQEGVQGAVFQMLSHGIVSGALFLCVGVVYDRLHTREIARYGGVASIMPHYAFVFMVFTLASIGLPVTSGFVGEFLVLTGAFEASSSVAFFATIGLILGAAYMLYLYRRVVFGVVTKDDVRAMLDLNWREKLIFAPLIALVFWMGIYPASFLDPIRASVTAEIDRGRSAAAYHRRVALIAPPSAASLAP